MPTLAVGAATANLNPPLGATIPGYFEVRRATGYHDDLLARAVYIAADPPLALVALDTISLRRELVVAIREQAARELEIPAELVFVCATHTHTGGPASAPFLTEEHDPAYLQLLLDRSVEALAAARERVQPAALGVASAQVPGLQFNRRYWMRDGSVQTNPGSANPEVVRPAGPVDPRMQVLAFRPLAGGPLALLVNYGLHCDTVGGTEISADFPGVLTQRLQAALGADTTVLFLQGAAGAINHIDVLGGEAPAEHSHELFMSTHRTAELTLAIGETLAAAVLDLLPGMAFAEDWSVAEAHAELTLATRQPTPEQLAHAHALLETHQPEDLHEADDIYDFEALRMSQHPETEATLELQILRLGPAALVGIPGEVFTELAQLIQSHSPWAETGIVELANGSEGYVPTARAFAEGGYEIRLARSSKLVPEAGDTIVAKATELLANLS